MEDSIVSTLAIDEYIAYFQHYNASNELNNSVTTVTILPISPENNSLSLLEHGGISVAVILALGVFVGILLDKIAAILKK